MKPGVCVGWWDGKRGFGMNGGTDVSDETQNLLFRFFLYHTIFFRLVDAAY